MPRKKYQKGIQEAVFETIENSKRKGHPYISKKDIIIHLKSQMGITLKDPNSQVGQALRQLQKKTKFRRPRIKKFVDKKGVKKGWVPVEEKYLFDPWFFPKQ